MAKIGTIPVIDGKTMAMVDSVQDEELSADAARLEGKNLRAGTAEYYAGLCLKGYIEGRHAEWALQSESDPAQQNALQNQLIGGYGTCSSNCKVASEQMSSSDSDLATKYRPQCEQGMAKQKSKISTDALARQVEAFKKATEPLALYFADRDSRQLLEMAASETDEGNLAQYSGDIERLSKQNKAAIAKGRAFFESSRAQTNFAAREEVQIEIGVLQSEIKDIRSRQEILNRNGSLDSHMRKRELDDQIRAKQRLLGLKQQKIEGLKAQYVAMAKKSGVVK